MDTLTIQLIKRYREELKTIENETEKKVMEKVIWDLEKMLYLYKPSATFTLKEWKD